MNANSHSADRDPETLPPELPADSSSPDGRRWPVVQKNALRNAVIGITLIGIVFGAMYSLALSYDLNAGLLLTTLGIVSGVFSVVFCLLGESTIEDGVKSVIIGINGCLLVSLFPLPWCLIPGAGAVVGSIVNGTIQATLGRCF